MASRNLRERLADVSVCVSERSGVRLLDAVDHTVPIPLFPQLQGSRSSHRRPKPRIVEEPLDRARHIAGTLADAEAVNAVGDHLAERRNVTADDGTLVQPCLEIADAEGLVQRGHREDIARVQRRGFLASAGSLDVDDALVRVAREVTPGVAAEELPPVRQWGQNDWSAKRLRDLERAIQIFAADVVDEVASLGVPLEDVGAHEVDKRGRVGDDPEKAAAGFDLHDLHLFAREDAAIVERLRAYHAYVMPTGGETRRELIREAFGSADARVRALREEELHREALGGKPRARTRRRCRPDR